MQHLEFGCTLLLTNFLLPDIELRWGGKILHADRTELSAEVISEMN